MGKKKTNGLHLFANSRRATYEQQSGRRLSHKMLMELAAVEFKNLSHEEQMSWLARPKQQTLASAPAPAAPAVAAPTAAAKATATIKAANTTTTTATTTAKNPTAAATPKAPVKITPAVLKTTSVLTSAQMGQRKSHFVEQELFKRTYKTGLDRATARDEFYGNLFWRESERLDELINRRWGFVVLSSEGLDVAHEIVCLCVEKSKIVSEMRIYRPEAAIGEKDRLHQLDCCWNVTKPEDINTACIRMNRFIQGCCYNYILVPAHQLGELSAVLHQMKATRDKLLDRETQSIRLDRLIAVEDAVMMLRKLKNLPEGNTEVDAKWEQLTGEWEGLTTVEHARAVADYFLGSLEPESVPHFDEDEEAAAGGGGGAVKQSLEETDLGRQKMGDAGGETVPRGPLWVTVTPERARFSDPTIQGTPRFVMGRLFNGPPVPLTPTTTAGLGLGPLLTPPEHISPRFRRQPLPRRWRNGPQQQQPSPPSFHDHHPIQSHHHQQQLSQPQETTNSGSDWNRPNPFAFPPQVVPDTKDVVYQTVSRWLDNISLNPAPVEEQQFLGEEKEGAGETEEGELLV